MKTTNIIIFISAALILSGCNFNFNFGKKGNGNVITQDRSVSENFTEIRATSGLDIYLTQGDKYKITVEADENLHQFISTDIKNGKLYITTSEIIGLSKAKKVYVTFIEVNTIEASSGAEIIGNSLIKSENLFLKCSGGSEMKIEVFSKELTAHTSSGAELNISGKASSLLAKASSGSEINARELLTVKCDADASSGAEIEVHVREELKANASSGAEIYYYGTPTTVNSLNSSSGKVKKK